MIERIARRWSGTPQEVARRVQAVGLTQMARLLSRVLGNQPPQCPQMPAWIGTILGSVMERLCAYDDPAMVAPSECEALAATREFMTGMPVQTQCEFQSLLVLIEVSPYLFGPRRARFSELRDAEQDQVLESWERSALAPMRAGFNAVKSLIMIGYWSRPSVWPAIGYSVVDNPGVPDFQRQMWDDIEGGDDDE